VTEHHPLFRRESWVAAGALSVGEVLMKADGSPTAVFSLQRIDAAATVYNFKVTAGTYVASGIVAHNKEDSEEYEQAPPRIWTGLRTGRPSSLLPIGNRYLIGPLARMSSNWSRPEEGGEVAMRWRASARWKGLRGIPNGIPLPSTLCYDLRK
jgi:hypothetical protein